MAGEFSDKPLTVDGVTVKPKWAWSDTYRREVADMLKSSALTHLPAGERELRYAKWYAAKHGLSLEEAIARLSG